MYTFLKRQMESSQWRPTRSQWLRFGISFALAVLLWGWVTQLKDPYTTRIIANVPIAMGDLPDTLQVVSTLPEVMVTLKGAESRVNPVRISDIAVEIDTSEIDGPGTYQVPLRVDAPNVNDRSVEPGELSIQVDERVSRIFPLNVSYSDGGDQTRTVGDVVPEVSQVTVTGPSSVVNRVADVVLPITIDRQSESYEADYVPVAVDASGQRVAEVAILPESVLTRVEVQTRGKPVSVIASVTGVPAEGHTVTQRRAIPDTIVVDGPDEVLNDLLFVNTEPVDVTEATESISTRVGLVDLPDGVTILEPTSGTVEVRVAVEDTSTSSQSLTGLPIEGVGLGEGLTVSYDPEAVSIQVSAPVDILQSMMPEDIGILVNLSGYGPGTYRLTPEVTVPQGATWLSSEPPTILVTIREGPPGTPEASPRP